MPSCLEDRSKASLLLKNYQLNGDQEKMLAELAETIIPKTETPGAKDIYAHLFVMKMIDDCTSKDKQQKFVKGMEDFEQMAMKETGKSFVQASTEQRAKLLGMLEQKKPEERDAAGFYKTVKSLTIRAYTSSQFYLTKVHVYELVPSRWHGCMPIKETA